MLVDLTYKDKRNFSQVYRNNLRVTKDIKVKYF
jgi:hypothetical protein